MESGDEDSGVTAPQEEPNLLVPIIQRVPKRNIFTVEEDDLLTKAVKIFGTSNWKKVAKLFKDKTARQIREHYQFSLHPNINRLPWTEDEDRLLLTLYDKHGPRWVFFQTFLDNRTPDSIKNRYRRLSKYTPQKHFPPIAPKPDEP